MMITSMLKSLAKMALTARAASFRPSPRPRPLIILGNGPSLSATLADHGDALERNPLLAVNYFANSPEFRRLKPEFYVLADPHFFDSTSDPNVAKLGAALAGVDWPMTLFLPFGAPCPAGANPCVKVERYPLLAAEGPQWFEDAAFSARRAMARPRNVLIPSIMIGCWLGFKEIYIVGADHSWPRTVSVTERNEVVSVQPHFYKEDSRETDRIRSVYQNVKLHQLLESWQIAFRSYHQIARWARRRGIAIYNSTPQSFIDAFERRPLPDD